jgi:hypothetical protein
MLVPRSGLTVINLCYARGTSLGDTSSRPVNEHPDSVHANCTVNIVANLPKARTVEPDKQPFLGNGCVTRNNGITVGSGDFLCDPCQGYIVSTSCH